MRALVFADRDGASIAPLNRQYAVALLPVAGKELIRFAVDELIAAGIRDIAFVLSEHAEKLEALLGKGERWGADFRYVLSRGAERPSTIWPRIRISDDKPLLVLRGDVLRSPCIAPFLESARGLAGSSIVGEGRDSRGALLLLRAPHGDPGLLLDRLHCTAPADAAGAKVIPLPDGDLSLLEDLRSYHQTNLDVIAGRFRGLAPEGREVALGLIAGRRATVSPRTLKQGQAYVGDNSRISPDAELMGEVMIAANVVVDRAATIYDSVILPHSYVGELVEVGNAIVSTDLLIRVDTGAVLNVTDAFLLGRLGGDDHEASERTSWPDRIGGVLLLLLSLPLWPLALASAAAASGAKMITGEPLIGNRRCRTPALADCDRAFFSWRFNTGIPVLALLPRVLDVIKGNLRLVGVAPLSPQQSEARSEDWQRVRDSAPVGLIGPTQLALTADAPLEERLMSDAFYAHQRGPLRDLRYLWQGILALFGAQAWQRTASD
jgi:NDP-sugar pyrophosphorylase family protein